jgi:N-terminal domain of NWD NACHT-NTPase
LPYEAHDEGDVPFMAFCLPDLTTIAVRTAFCIFIYRTSDVLDSKALGEATMRNFFSRKSKLPRKRIANTENPVSESPSETSSHLASVLVNPSRAADKPPKSLDSDAALASTPVIPTNSEPSDLWDRAEEALSNGKDKGKAKILHAYLEILKSQLWSELAERGTAARQEQMCQLLNAKVEELEKQKWRVRLGDHDVEIGNLFASVVSNMLLAKDIVASAASADPNAALACAGVSVILSVSLAAFQLFSKLTHAG